MCNQDSLARAQKAKACSKKLSHSQTSGSDRSTAPSNWSMYVHFEYIEREMVQRDIDHREESGVRHERSESGSLPLGLDCNLIDSDACGTQFRKLWEHLV